MTTNKRTSRIVQGRSTKKMMEQLRQIIVTVFLGTIVSVSACSRKTSEQAKSGNNRSISSLAGKNALTLPVIDVNEEQAAIYMFYNGTDFDSVSRIEDIPEAYRGWVRVVPRLRNKAIKSGSHAQSPDALYVADLRAKRDAGNYPYVVMTRKSFENAAMFKQDAGASEVTDNAEISAPSVILYATDWCGVCKKARQWLTKKNIDFVEKNIEEDRAAAAEMKEKATKQGVSTNGVPVIDVGGTLMSGFDEKRISQLLSAQ